MSGFVGKQALNVVTDSDGRLGETVRHFGGRGLRSVLLGGAAAINTRAAPPVTDGCDGRLTDGSGLLALASKARNCGNDGR